MASLSKTSLGAPEMGLAGVELYPDFLAGTGDAAVARLRDVAEQVNVTLPMMCVARHLRGRLLSRRRPQDTEQYSLPSRRCGSRTSSVRVSVTEGRLSSWRLAGLNALVTGSTTGIGEAIAQRFALEGARVLIHGLNATDANAVVSDIRAMKGDAVAVAGDLGDPSVHAELACQANELLGSVDILVNNAAVKTRTNLETTDGAIFDRILAVNLSGSFAADPGLAPAF